MDEEISFPVELSPWISCNFFNVRSILTFYYTKSQTNYLQNFHQYNNNRILEEQDNFSVEQQFTHPIVVLIYQKNSLLNTKNDR